MENNSNATWTEGDDRLLLKLKSAGTSNRKMADTLGRSVSAIEQRLSCLSGRAVADGCGPSADETDAAMDRLVDERARPRLSRKKD